MRTRPIGGSGLSLSAVGLGGYELGPEPDESPDIDRAASVIAISRDVGVTWVDTSENYHATSNEDVIGAALRQVGGDFAVATKVAPHAAITGGGSGFRPEQIDQACRGSLERLQREVIDLYLLHWPDDTGVPLEETWGAMASLVEQGLVRAIGLCNYGLEEIERCHAQRPVDAIQTGLSLVDYLDDRPLIEACGALGIAVTVYEPLASGVLTGLSLDAVRSRWTGPWEESAFYRRLLSAGKGERSIAVADGLRPIADKLGASVAQVAIAWVLHQRGVRAAIVGTRDGKHMRENARAADVELESALGDIEALIPLGPAYG